MNHERVNLLLDTKPAAGLTAAERQAVDQHLASCSECREMWEAYDELAALRIPATPPYLRVRVATALAARAAGRSDARRGLFIGVVLLVGAAVAAAVLRWTNDLPDPLPGSVPAIEDVAPAVEPVAPPEPPVPSDEPVPSSPEPVEPSAAADTVMYPLDPYSVLVVSLNDPDPDTEATAMLAACHDAVVEQLRGVVGLNVMAGDRLKIFSGSTSSEIEAARQLGAGRLLILRPVMRQPRCNAWSFDVQTGAIGGGGLTAIDNQESWSGFGAAVARLVQEDTFKNTDARAAEARAAVLNTGLDDFERASALIRLRPWPAAPVYDEATLAAAVQIGMTSRDANARARAWGALRGATDPYILPPLLHAIANDAAEDVRSAAALTLASFRDQPAVRDALTRAAAEVPSEPPKVSCCSLTVRSAARLALRAGDEPAEAVRARVLDESLTPQERLVLARLDGNWALLDQLGDEAAQAVFALGSSADDDEVRSRAWSLLGDVSEQGFVPALLEDLARHPAETVRAAAAAGLRQHRDDPDVRAALDRALADSSVLVQRGARNALDGVKVDY